MSDYSEHYLRAKRALDDYYHFKLAGDRVAALECAIAVVQAGEQLELIEWRGHDSK